MSFSASISFANMRFSSSEETNLLLPNFLSIILLLTFGEVEQREILVLLVVIFLSKFVEERMRESLKRRWSLSRCVNQHFWDQIQEFKEPLFLNFLHSGECLLKHLQQQMVCHQLSCLKLVAASYLCPWIWFYLREFELSVVWVHDEDLLFCRRAENPDDLN